MQRKIISVGTSGFDGKQDSNFLNVFYTKLRLEYIIYEN